MGTALLITVVGWCALGQVAQDAAGAEGAAESVDVRYARAQLELAEANLSRVQQSNKQVAGAVPRTVVAEFQYDVEVAKARLERARGGGAGAEFQVWLRRAESERRAAEDRWKSAMAANERAPGTLKPLDVDRLRLRAEVAGLQLERGQALAGAPREAQLEWEVELLDNQVQRLKEEAGRASSFIGLYPVWVW